MAADRVTTLPFPALAARAARTTTGLVTVALLAAGCGSGDGAKALSSRRDTTTRSAPPTEPATLGVRPDETALVSLRAKLLFGYDYRSMEQTRSRARDVTGPPWQREYLQTMEQAIPIARSKHAIVKASIAGIGLVSRDITSSTFLVFLNQTTSSDEAKRKVDLSRILLTLTPTGIVTGMETAEPEDAPVDMSPLGALEREAAEAIWPLLTIDASDVDAALRRVLDNATGTFRADFSSRSASLRDTLVANDVVADAPRPLVAIRSATDTSVSVLAAADTRVTNKSAPDGRSNTYRISARLVREKGRLLISELEFVG